MGVGGGLTGLGIGYIMVQRSNGAHGRPFTRYTLPTLEVRMVLEAMRERNESFELEYTRIAGAPPLDDHAAAEEWRASGCGTRVRLREADGARDCSAVDTCAAGDWFVRWAARRACAEDELAVLATPPGWLARKLLLANPYPILQPAGRYCGSSG
ncbi:hypothetical protein EMIHUDRAFT_433009 [Emiliania huxleyi CCMP1516]|uniref:Uncharacterized protein n=2 Tax=Emiliania huxleyi TaxID=2903 RepID=A0A0D3I7B5_EMIH1|nr:hypothetical protein EMIHUDRAFT_433009 [Emiliania huxleyi CCMP1516]EOD07150.1 hypothetical protein EMIHUDRAFT_433009 [Emiliania huxleyi CCMP1516]|eukprot:XP_005759579.1 hypothetical protein EMIHUDRAFT_433009 [Emiliania huxleyi CCMP1516]